jgi:hypothetical protein
MAERRQNIGNLVCSYPSALQPSVVVLICYVRGTIIHPVPPIHYIGLEPLFEQFKELIPRVFPQLSLSSNSLD